MGHLYYATYPLDTRRQAHIEVGFENPQSEHIESVRVNFKGIGMAEPTDHQDVTEAIVAHRQQLQADLKRLNKELEEANKAYFSSLKVKDIEPLKYKEANDHLAQTITMVASISKQYKRILALEDHFVDKLAVHFNYSEMTPFTC